MRAFVVLIFTGVLMLSAVASWTDTAATPERTARAFSTAQSAQ